MPYNAYLRTLRARWALSQEEIANLLNISQGRISRYEKGEEAPTLQAVLGLQVIFGASPRDLFPSVFSAIEEGVMRRAATLERALETKGDAASVQKQALLSDMMVRATKRDDA